MGERQDKLKGILVDVLKDYCSDDDLNNITNFLIKVVDSVDDTSITVSNMDKFMFTQSVRNVSIGVSRDLIIETMKSSMSRVKNLVKPSKLSKSSGYVHSTDYESNSAEFDIDISAIPKVNGKVVRGSLQSKVFSESNVFEGSFDADLDKINSSKAKVSKGSEGVPMDSDDSSDDLPFVFGSDDVSTDASKFNGDYTDVPDINVDIDY